MTATTIIKLKDVAREYRRLHSSYLLALAAGVYRLSHRKLKVELNCMGIESDLVYDEEPVHAGDGERTIEERNSEAVMTFAMACDTDSELVETNASTVVANASNPDPMRMVEQLPEISVPVGSLVAGFHLRQDGTDANHVRLLADAAGSVKLPSILVQRHGLRIIDGMHRLEVAKLRGEWDISARIVDCTDEQALVLAVRSNTLHGLPLTRAERISSAKRILTAHADWSDRAVAAITGLSAKAIASVRNSAAADMQFNGKRLGRDGKRRPVAPGEGRQRAAEYINTHPGASLREVARETDVSIGTAHDVREKIRCGVIHALLAPECPPEQFGGRRAAADRARPPVPARALHPAAGTRTAQRLTWRAISAKLVGDPTIRYTEGGRAFLRWMDAHSMRGDEWREFIDAVPQHWLKDVSRVAASMSEEWRQFAERLGDKLEAAS